MNAEEAESLVRVKPGHWRTRDGVYDVFRDPQPEVWRAESRAEGFGCSREIWLIYERDDNADGEPSWVHGPGGGRMWGTLREVRGILPELRRQDLAATAKVAGRRAILSLLAQRRASL